ncbi:unnamed protein product [Prorocentrum cordatum]|uniref:Uncharacterized protein n=1 Tax=Prorocentrum cordatum TaxID=2364126 RepID=A0ABN9YDH0_9DINO|nr:unnamed protein product [Polarella glacialis]
MLGVFASALCDGNGVVCAAAMAVATDTAERLAMRRAGVKPALVRTRPVWLDRKDRKGDFVLGTAGAEDEEGGADPAAHRAAMPVAHATAGAVQLPLKSAAHKAHGAQPHAPAAATRSASLQTGDRPAAPPTAQASVKTLGCSAASRGARRAARAAAAAGA